ncbi:ROK family transcriptional regulator [Streptomyces sp. 7-21]|uniref:ROK family transcriptional regulator n=1 Tax=Streptomyces sp. 7-21 TaxID=2802283 RepID=UPI00191CF2E0|nr:ROK family transcriptional regulator [Streptomyces sp. 7-21]MBL1068802.1 ROK family transcriptional regulator [Streptomyces sp. 7-21]
MTAVTGRTVHDLRRGNRALLLRRLFFDGPLSRQELGPATGLSSGTVSNVTAGLLADGFISEVGSVESDGGRPRTLLAVAPDGGRLIGVDVGETRVRVSLFGLTLDEMACAEYPLAGPVHDPEYVAARIGEGVSAVLADVPGAAGRLLGVGVGVPGIVEQTPAGAVVHGQAVGWHAVPLEALLRRTPGWPADVPCYVGNGARTFGQAEMWFGAGRGAGDVVVALLGSGVGACVVTGGATLGGPAGAAGEWGHTTVTVGGRTCRCGARGCLEAYVGADALVRRWAETGGRPLGDGPERAVAALLDADRDGDEGAAAVLAETAEYLGAGIADLVNLFNPERILLGGWAGLILGPRLLPDVRRYARRYALRHPAGRARIEMGRLGPDAVTVGAATLPLADFLSRGGAQAAGV